MTKKIVEMILMIGIFASFMGCGNSNVESMGMETSNIGVASSVSAVTGDSEIQNVEAKEINASALAEEEECTYIERTDIYMVDHIDSGDGTQIDRNSMEEVREQYKLSDSIDIYSYFGTYAGYTKPEIEIMTICMNDEWVMVSFKECSFNVKREDFERVAVEKGSNTEEMASVSATDEIVPVVEDKVASVEAEKEPAAEPPVVETPVVAESTKYTPEEVFATYRSILEANGMIWDPSIKDIVSWGTGMLTYDNIEAQTQNDLAGFAYGDGAGNPKTHYYMEITGSDETYIYFTRWSY